MGTRKDKNGGMIKTWNGDFGFVAYPGGEIFLHKSEVENEIKPKRRDLVSFEIIETDEGLRAKNARIMQ